MARLSRTRRKSSSPAAVIRTDAAAEIPVPGGPVLQEFAIRWAYLIRNRTHWNKTKWAAMRSQLQRQVKSVGFRQADFRKLGECQLIEVEIPFRREEDKPRRHKPGTAPAPLPAFDMSSEIR